MLGGYWSLNSAGQKEAIKDIGTDLSMNTRFILYIEEYVVDGGVGGNMIEKSFELRDTQRITIEYKISPTSNVGEYRFIKCNIVLNSNNVLKHVDIANNIMSIICKTKVMYDKICEITYILDKNERMFIGTTGVILMDDIKLFEDSLDMEFVATSIGGVIRGEKLTYLNFVKKKGE